jgi:hypothetical protein
MIAYCGLDCLKCECYIATQENDEKNVKMWQQNGLFNTIQR